MIDLTRFPSGLFVGRKAARRWLFLAVSLLALASMSCDATSPREYGRWSPKAGQDIRCVAFSPDGKYLAVGVAGIGTISTHEIFADHWKGRLELYDVATKTLVAQQQVDQWINSIDFSPEGDLIAVGTGAMNPGHKVEHPPAPGELVLYAVPGLKEKARYTSKISDSEVMTVAFHPKGTHIYGLVRSITEKRGEVRQWSSPSLEQGFVITQKEGEEKFSSMALTAEGATVLVGDRVLGTNVRSTIGVLHLIDSKTGERHVTLDTTVRSSFDHIAVSASDNIVVGLSWAGSGQIFDISKKELLDPRLLVVGGNGVRDYEFSRDGLWYAQVEYRTGSGHWSDLSLRSRKSEKSMSWRERDCRYQQIAFSPDGKLLAAIGRGPKDAVPSLLIVIWQTP